MKHYHYLECGLKNIFLANGFNQIETKYGHAVSFDDVEGLHKAIGSFLMLKAGILTGMEHRFLRKETGLTHSALGKMFGLDLQTPANWEKGKNPIKPMTDVCLRQLYSEKILKKRKGFIGLVKLTHQPVVVNDYQLFEMNEHWQTHCQPEKALNHY